MNKEINVLEIASELADKRLRIQWEYEGRADEITIEDDGGCITYTEEAQDMFNEYYDEYYDMIVNDIMDMKGVSNDAQPIPQFINNVDWSLLRDQKNTIVGLASSNIVHLIDSIQDYAVDVLKIDSGEVFGNLDIKEE